MLACISGPNTSQYSTIPSMSGILASVSNMFAYMKQIDDTNFENLDQTQFEHIHCRLY